MIRRENIVTVANLEILNMISKEMLKRGIYKPKETKKENIESIFYDKINQEGYNLNQDTFSKIRSGRNIAELINESKLIAMSSYANIDIAILIGNKLLEIDSETYEDFSTLIKLKNLKSRFTKQCSEINLDCMDDNRKSENYGLVYEDDRNTYIDIEEAEAIVPLFNEYLEYQVDKDMFLSQMNKSLQKDLLKGKVTYIRALTALTLNISALNNTIKETEEIITDKLMIFWKNVWNGDVKDVYWLQVKQFFIRKLFEYDQFDSIMQLLGKLTSADLQKYNMKTLESYKRVLNNTKKNIDEAIKLK